MSFDDIRNKVAIVTGGGHGVGRGIALALGSAGVKVVVCGRTPETLESVRQEIEAAGGTALDIVCDITVAEARRALIDRTLAAFGGINILINNAALVPHGSLLEIDDGLIQAALDAGPLASLQLMRLCHPHLKGDGAIVNVSSGVAIAGNVPNRGIYAAAKAALNAISRAAANEWAPDNIRVNIIMPMARTEAFERWMANEPQQAAAIVRTIPLGRPGHCVDDIAPVVLFLVSSSSAYVTGATIPVDGGLAYVN